MVNDNNLFDITTIIALVNQQATPLSGTLSLCEFSKLNQSHNLKVQSGLICEPVKYAAMCSLLYLKVTAMKRQKHNLLIGDTTRLIDQGKMPWSD